MNGLEGACDAVTGYLTAGLPAKTAQLRERYAVTAEQLPDVTTVLPHDVDNLGIEQWPAVLVIGQNMTGAVLLDVDDAGDELYRCTYRLHVYVFARGPSYAGTDALRKRLTLGVRELLLVQPGPAPQVLVDRTTLTESYSDLALDEQSRTVGAAYIRVDVTVEESLNPEVAAVRADAVVVDTANLPPHPDA